MNDTGRSFTPAQRLIVFVGALGAAGIVIQILQFLEVVRVLNVVSKVLAVVVVGLLALLTTVVIELQETKRPQGDEHGIGLEPTELTPNGNDDVDRPNDGVTEVTDVGTSRTHINLQEVIASTEQRLDFLGLSWAPLASEGPMEQLFDAVSDGAIQTRILVLNPFLSTTMQRNPDMYTSRGLDPLPINIARSIVVFRRLTERLDQEGDRLGGDFDAGIYTDIPTMSCYFIDNRLNFTPYVVHRTGMQSPYIEVERSADGSLYDIYAEHFERLHDDAIPVETEQLTDELQERATRYRELPNEDIVRKVEEILAEGDE